tara:strand:+ start:71 stop:304 length:234 start_codon:yes stop_codon:yes gene_type:complete
MTSATNNQITMTDQNTKPDKKKFNYSKMKLGLGMGIAIGVVIGAVIDNTSTGITIGIAIGAVIGTAMGSVSRNSKKK